MSAAAAPVRAHRPDAPTAAELGQVIAGLRAAQPRLARRSSDEVVALLDDVVEAWLAPDSPWLARAEALLPAASGFSPAMVRYALPTMLAPLRAPALAALLARESAGRRGPALVLHVLAGNLPGLAAVPAALSLAIGAAALLKPGRGDRIFPALWAGSIAARDADLGACVAALYWPGGARECDDAALAAADLVVASGDDATIAALAGRARGRFIGHGHRVSFAVVGREVATEAEAADRAAAALADDVAIWDQRGCLSPQFCLVEGDRERALDFARRFAEALRPLATSLPPAAMTDAERLAVRRLRDDAEWRGLAGEAVQLFACGGDGAGTVVVEPAARFLPSPLARSLRVMPVASLAEIAALLAPVRGALECAGLAAAPPRWNEAAAMLGAAGVPRVCPLGAMQRPGLDWRQGGRPRLADWLA